MGAAGRPGGWSGKAAVGQSAWPCGRGAWSSSGMQGDSSVRPRDEGRPARVAAAGTRRASAAVAARMARRHRQTARARVLDGPGAGVEGAGGPHGDSELVLGSGWLQANAWTAVCPVHAQAPVIATRPSVTLPALPCGRGRPRTCGLGVGGPLPPWDRGFESPARKPTGHHRARAAARPDAPDRCTSPHRRARQTRLGGRAGPARSGGGAWQLENREWRYRADGGNSRGRPAGGGPGTDRPRVPHAPVTAGRRCGRRA